MATQHTARCRYCHKFVPVSLGLVGEQVEAATVGDALELQVAIENRVEHECRYGEVERAERDEAAYWEWKEQELSTDLAWLIEQALDAAQKAGVATGRPVYGERADAAVVPAYVALTTAYLTKETRMATITEQLTALIGQDVYYETYNSPLLTLKGVKESGGLLFISFSATVFINLVEGVSLEGDLIVLRDCPDFPADRW